MKPWQRYQENTRPSKPWERYQSDEPTSAKTPAGFQHVQDVNDGSVFRNSQTGQLTFRSSGFSTSNQEEIQELLDGSSLQDVRKQSSAELTLDQNSILQTIGGAASSFVAGLPFVGEYADEAFGQIAGDETQDRARALRNTFETANPKSALGLQIAGGVTGAAPLVATGLPALSTISSPAGRVAAGATAAGIGGAAEGFVSGYGSGVDETSRRENAGTRSLIGGGIGAFTGAAAPLVSSGIKNATSRLLPKPNTGLSREANQIISDTLKSDGLEEGLNRVSATGNEGFLADAGQNTQALLDTAIQKSGRAGVIAKDAIEHRANNANTNITNALDGAFGVPEGRNALARAIADNSASSRQAAYDAAYKSPIDYSTGSAGDKVLSVVKRVPGRILNKAIRTANEAMQIAGTRNNQILSDVAEDGSVSLKNLPNVQQLDEIKRALGELAEREVDQFGRRTAEGNRISSLASQLREAVAEAVPSYRKAVQLGGDKIAEDNALRLGTNIFKPSTTREHVVDLLRNATDAERKAAASGIRSQLDETLANVRRTVTDGNVEARQAIAATKQLSSQANRDKIAEIIGSKKSGQLFKELEDSLTALELRAAVSQNSKTFARQNLNDTIQESIQGGAIQAAREGRPVNASQRILQAFTGATPQAAKARSDKIYTEIVEALTKPKGKEAQELIKKIKTLNSKQAKNQKTARMLSNQLTSTSAATFDRTGNQYITNRFVR